MGILRKHSEKFEPWGLDEAFLDISFRVQNWEEAINLAKTIKHDIYEKVKLTCSIGVAPNKLVAKIASDVNKPDSITAVAEDAVEKFLAPLSVRKLLWVGKQTERKMNEMGIHTIRDLGAVDVSKLVKRFGIMGRRFHLFAHGIYDSEVGKPRGMIKSIGHERTFSTDTDDHDTILKMLDTLCQRIHKRVVQRQILFKTVTVKIRDEEFQTHTHSKSWRTYINCLHDLVKVVRSLSKKQFCRNAKIRLVGVRVSNLTHCKGQRTLI
jgi:DNA polymerase IV (DinB-like DNA polymerase)